MAVHKRINSVAYPAGLDLSAYQFCLMQISSDGQIDPVENDDTPVLGVLLNKPAAAGAGAEVAVVGSDVKVKAAGAIDEGRLVIGGAGGMVTAGPLGGTAAGTAFIVGICTQAASGSGAYAGVLLQTPYLYSRA